MSTDLLGGIAAYDVRFLPIVKAYADKIGLVQVINELVPSKMDVQPGHMVLAMIMDTLTGRSPLYHIETFWKSQDIELLLGKAYRAGSFHDDTVERILDKLYDVGTMRIFSEVAVRAAQAFSVEKRYVHFDTTSVSVYGEYEPSPDDPFAVTFGHSKDHRPDLKQFVLSMLCVDRNVPIFGKTEDGNSSDKSLNNVILSELSCRMAKHGLGTGSYIYVADSALVSEINLRALDGTLFISRLPSTYNECGRAITEAISRNEWQELGVLAQTKTTTHRPGAFYKVYETEVSLHGKSYRAVVAHSSAHDKRRKKKIERELKEDRKALEALIGDEAKRKYFCTADAEGAAKRLSASESEYHNLSVEILEKQKYGRGRPKKGEAREVKETHYTLTVNLKEKEDAVARKRQEAGCFVLLSNVPKDGEMAHSEAEILNAYKEQHGIEQNFAFLKDPLIVNSLFLKKPERIEALGLVLLLSLLIWRLMERSLRQHVETTHSKIMGLNNTLTDRPTAHMITRIFHSVMIIKVVEGRRLAHPLSAGQLDYLKALGVNSTIFCVADPSG